MQEVLANVTVRVTQNSVPLQNAFVGLEGEKIVSNEQGIVSFTNVEQGIYDITVQYEGKLYVVRAVVASPQIDISITGRQAIKEVPPARQEAYRIANETAPQFIGFLIVLGILLTVLFLWLDVRLKKMKGYLKALIRMAVFLIVSILAVVIFSFVNGTNDKLFALILPQTSARAGENAVPPPVGLTITREENQADLKWSQPPVQDQTIVGYEIAIFEQKDKPPIDLFFTSQTAIRIPLPDPNKPYQMQVRSVVGTVDPTLSIGVSGTVPTR